MSDVSPTLQTRLEAFLDFKVKHPCLEEMDRDLMQRIQGHRRYTMLAIYGASGVGKSTVMQRVAKRLREGEADPSVMPVVVVKASPEDIGASARLVTFAKSLTTCNGMSECATG
jgi:Cdc6-like AAA superfamily ATPase